jgi:hypothetical protein
MTCSDANCVSSRCKSCRWNRSVATVVISSCAKGDRRVGSLEVKVPFWGASKSAGRSKGEPVSPEIPLRREVPSACHLREGRVVAKKLIQQRRALRGRRGRHVEKEHTAKARNHSWVASAFPHSEDSAYKPLAVKSCCACEWGGWGRKALMVRDRITRNGARAPGVKRRMSLERWCAIESNFQPLSWRSHRTTKHAKDERKPNDGDGHAGNRLNHHVGREGLI